MRDLTKLRFFRAILRTEELAAEQIRLELNQNLLELERRRASIEQQSIKHGELVHQIDRRKQNVVNMPPGSEN